MLKLWRSVHRIRIWMPILLILPVILFFLINKTETVALVNREPISIREFEQAVIETRSDVYSYFNQTYGAEHNTKFWTSSYEGEVPADMAKAKALDVVKRIKIQQILAKQKKIVQDISYSGFLDDLEIENKRRTEAVNNNKAIYGPVHYGEKEYYSYVFSNMVIQLKGILGEEELAASEKELLDFYDSIKETTYKREDTIKAQKLSLSWVDKEGNVDRSMRSAARRIMEQWLIEVENGATLAEIATSFTMEGSLEVQLNDLVFEESNARYDHHKFQLLKEEAKKLKVGQVSGMIEENNAIHLIRCIEKIDEGHQSYDEVKENVKSLYVDESYRLFIDRLSRDTEVEIDNQVYDNIKIQ